VAPSPSHVQPVAIRAHSLLCLQGFRGKGYDETFVAEMTAVHRALSADPDTPVRVLAGPDRLCRACPNLGPRGCTLQGPEHEAHMVAQDEAVLARLWLTAGEVLPWSRILERIARAVAGADLPGLCTTCPWLPLGWCAEGLERLRAPPPHPPPQAP
jgi:uncharacterized protein